jgi:hypothetical protein
MAMYLLKKKLQLRLRSDQHFRAISGEFRPLAASETARLLNGRDGGDFGNSKPGTDKERQFDAGM